MSGGGGITPGVDPGISVPRVALDAVPVSLRGVIGAMTCGVIGVGTPGVPGIPTPGVPAGTLSEDAGVLS